MKRKGFLSLISLILAVALVITALSSCSANDNSLVLCNIKYDSDSTSRELSARLQYSLEEINTPPTEYKATYKGNGASYCSTVSELNDGYVAYDKDKGILLSQGLWEIECKWVTDSNTVYGSTGEIWVNLNTTVFHVTITGIGETVDTGTISVQYSVTPSADYPVPYISGRIITPEAENVSLPDSISLNGQVALGVQPFSLNTGKYLLILDIKESSTSTDTLFTDVLGFIVKGGMYTIINGSLDNLPNKIGSTSETYMEEFWDSENDKNIVNDNNVITIDNTVSANTDTTKKDLSDVTIENNHNYVLKEDTKGSNNIDLGHSNDDDQSATRLITPISGRNFGINLNGTNVTVSTVTQVPSSENTTVVQLNSNVVMNLYNKVKTISGDPTDMKALAKKYSATWGLSDEDFKRRFDANVSIVGGRLNVIGPSTDNSISNGGVVLSGPKYYDCNSFGTAGFFSYKQGSINISDPGGEIVLDGIVTVDGAIGISSRNPSIFNTDNQTLTGLSNTKILIKNGAKIDVTGDTGSYPDTAYGILLDYASSTSSNSTLDIALDNGHIITQRYGSNNDTSEAGICINGFTGTLNIVIKNDSTISSHGSGIKINNCTGTVNIIFETTNPSSVFSNCQNDIFVFGSSNVSVTIVNGINTITNNNCSTITSLESLLS